MSCHRTAVCTVATGPHEELYEVSGPTFERFARHHGYDLIVAHHELSGSRPPPWGKLALLRELVDSYDRVVWIDADAVVVDPVGDIFETMGPLHALCLATHHYQGAEIPNMGVIATTGARWTKRFLERLWASEHYIDHKWWENAAALELLGYDVEAPRADTRRRTWASRRVGQLDLSWNSISLDPAPRPRIVHFPGMTQHDRLVEMRRTLELAGMGGDGVTNESSDTRRAIVNSDVGRRGLVHMQGVSER